MMAIFTRSMTLAGLISSTPQAHSYISKANQIPVSSQVGMNILSEARRLEDGFSSDLSFLPNYSFKVQGCSHVTDWNYNANEENEVRLTTKRLLRLRLCPADSCATQYGLGCNGNDYGDYVVPLDSFLTNYLQYKAVADMEDCTNYSYKKCGCENNQECDFQCWYKHDMNQCYTDYTNNGYGDDGGITFPYENYLSCAEWNPNDYRRRKLDEAFADDAAAVEEDDMAGDDVNVAKYDEGEQKYYIGPYCAKQGTRVYLGVFTDDTCTDFAGSHGGKYVFKDLTGETLPYSEMPIIRKDCVRCNIQLQDVKDQRRLEDAAEEAEDEGEEEAADEAENEEEVEEEAENEEDEGEEDEDRQEENQEEYYGYEYEGGFCEGVYLNAGKCESNLNAGNQDNRGCNFINGISFVEQYSEKRVHSASSFVSYYVNEGMYFLNTYIDYFIMGAGALFLCLFIQVSYKKTKLAMTRKARMKEFEDSLESDAKIKASYLAMR